MIMTMSQRDALRRVVTDIVIAHLSHNTVPGHELPELIRSVHAALSDAPAPIPAPVAVSPRPSVPIRKSVFPDHLICLEDGLRMKMLKRHLQAAHGLTPEQYRERWSLPASYPMAAPNYVAPRLAALNAPAPAPGEIPVQTIAPAVRGKKPARPKAARPSSPAAPAPIPAD